MSFADLMAELIETCFRLFPFPCRTGVRLLGKPGPESPVLLTCNYDLTVRRVVRALRGLDAYLVVCSSHGINVWCAASGGHFTTHQVVTALKLCGLEGKVNHRQVILPQLAATGVEGKEVRRRTGWVVRFGPVYASDIPAYLQARKQKNDKMRRVRFGARERLEMAIAWATPIGLAASLLLRSHLLPLWGLIVTLAIAVFFIYERLPGGQRARQALLAVAGAAGCLAVMALSGTLETGPAVAWGLGSAGAVGLLTFDYAGSSPTEASGLFEERRFRVALDLERCKGIYACWAVCPQACFDKLTDTRKVAITHGDRCIRCGACVVQCPEDALAFTAPGGQRIEPSEIRRFKLNLLGKRVRAA